MIADNVQSNFPDGVALPKCIRVLCEYLDEYGYPLSGCFEISTRGDQEMRSWFKDDESMQRQFAVFGNGSTGSTYALWLTKNPNPNEAPVVVLGSEGEFVVLALNALEFCRLLGCGYDEVEWDDLSKSPKMWEETATLRDWLSERLNLETPATGEEIRRAASDRYPDFGDWVRNWQDANL